MLYIGEKEQARFQKYLEWQEKSPATVQKYLRDLRLLAEHTGGRVEGKGELIAFKEALAARGYAVASINSMLAAVNRFLEFSGYGAWKLRFLKRQRTLFSSRDRELSQADYQRLVKTAARRGDERLALLLQTICATGIRVGELRGVTVEALRRGQAQILSKGKVRQILLPRALCRLLLGFCGRRNIRAGSVFVTRSGAPLDRSNLWKMMKGLCRAAGVGKKKVFPHNLRHLFARTFYKKYKDVVRLADLLGHSSVDTTRIYTTGNGCEQQRQLESLCLLL